MKVYIKPSTLKIEPGDWQDVILFIENDEEEPKSLIMHVGKAKLPYPHVTSVQASLLENYNSLLDSNKLWLWDILVGTLQLFSYLPFFRNLIYVKQRHIPLYEEYQYLDWVTLMQERVQMASGAKTAIPITIKPPRKPDTLPGAYVYEVSIYNEQTEVARVSSNFIVLSYINFTSNLKPVYLQNGRQSKLKIQNSGNEISNFTFDIVGDSSEVYIAKTKDYTVTVPPNGEDIVVVKLKARNRPFFAMKGKYLPFTLTLSSDNQISKQTHSGALRVGPGFGRVFLILILLFILFVVFSELGF